MSEPVLLSLLLALGVWAAIDGIAVGQFMISRPFVSGTLAGWILADPATGLLLGGILEAAHFGGLPVGAARLPEPGPAAVPAVWAAIEIGGAGGVAVGAALGAVWSLLGGTTISLQRRSNGWITRRIESADLTEEELSRRHWGCVALDALRGALLTGSGLAAAAVLARGSWPQGWGLDREATLTLLLLPGLLAGGALLRGWLHPVRRRLGLLLLGFVVGALVMGAS